MNGNLAGILNVALWGLVAGIIHFIAMSGYYLNPLTAKVYKKEEDHPSMRHFESQPKYLIIMFFGTQIEVYILAAAYVYLRQFFPEPSSWMTMIAMGILFSLIRSFPRSFNMYMQTSYPNKLNLIEFFGGIFSTFVILVSLKILPL